jgi:NAD(P)-dependent dehydrogenase (short-subunit alcohol dehydrogenase family)
MKPTEGYLRGGVAVVTGAGSGLGAAMATRFSEQGMKIAALDIDGQQAKSVALRLASGADKAIDMECDVSNRAALEEAAGRVEARFGECSVVCANVGVQQFGAVERLTENDWRWVLNVNVMGVIYTVDAFLPLLRKATGPRHIVVTSSSAAYSPGIRMAAYTTSKYAITGYAETLRMELAGEGIGVTVLFPAGMSTRHLQSSQKARPAELGPSHINREDIDAMMGSRKIDVGGHVATADYATRHLIAALAENRRYLITHGNCREVLVSNFEELLAAHDRAQLD